VRQMFSPDEIRTHVARVAREQREMDANAMNCSAKIRLAAVRTLHRISAYPNGTSPPMRRPSFVPRTPPFPSVGRVRRRHS
jgi:hypothetical protein